MLKLLSCFYYCIMSHSCLCNFTNIVGFRLYRLIVKHNLKIFICNTNFKEHNLSPHFKNINTFGVKGRRFTSKNKGSFIINHY